MEVYLALFISAFLSATFLPGASELLVVKLMQEHYDVVLLWSYASAGNTLGSVLNWYLGRYFLHFEDKKWFPFNLQKLDKTQQWFQRYGEWSMLLAWLPIVGDGLTFIAGLMKMNFYRFVILVALGKGARYAVLLGILSVVF